MAQRKHTRCSQCGTIANCRLLELLWRLDGVGPWTWCSGYPCPVCRSAWLDFVGQLANVYVAIDG